MCGLETYGHTATETMVFVLSETDFETKIDLSSLTQIAVDFKVLREKNKEHEGSLIGIDFQMLLNQVPGGMLSNLESQLKDLKNIDTPYYPSFKEIYEHIYFLTNCQLNSTNTLFSSPCS